MDECLRGRAQKLLVRAEAAIPALKARGDAPVVVAAIPDWAPSPRTDDAFTGLRAALRGLGATLVIFSGHDIGFFGADDEVGTCPAPDDDAEGQAPLVSVFDGTRALRYADTLEAADARGATEALVVALSRAARTLASRVRPPLTVTRREWVIANLVGAFALSLGGCSRRSQTSPDAGHAQAATELDVVLDVNGEAHPLRVDPRVSLLDALRERLGLTGTKKGCDHGQCGACTVLVDGRRSLACLTLVVMAEGKKVTTIEGLARGDALHPVQRAFVQVDAFQCGYCTPGQIMSAVGLLKERRPTTDEEIREQMSGNLCRCGAYPNIVAAVRLARDEA